jgi:hypothetical protein
LVDGGGVLLGSLSWGEAYGARTHDLPPVTLPASHPDPPL